MKKRIISMLLATTMVLGLVACGGKQDSSTDKKGETTSESASKSDGETPESSTVTWAMGNVGNLLVYIAQEQGYFDEVGINIETVDMYEGQAEAILTGQIDVASEVGTYNPIKMIVAGDDVAIMGGYMLTGCMPIIARKGTEWKGSESFLGHTYADTKSRYASLHELVDEGYDLDKDVNIIEGLGDDEKIAAILKGEADFATLSTGKMQQVLNDEDLEVVSYLSEITPNYSCCRMIVRESWIEKNPTTAKLIDECLIRAQCYFESHKEETVDLLVDKLNVTKDYVESFLLNEHYRINPDPLKNGVMDNYEFMEKINSFDHVDDSVKLEDRIYVDIYKEALDAVVEKYGDEDPEFYENAVKFYEENNL